MIKVLFFIPSLSNSAGMERISTSLANLLVNNGYNCNFVVLTRGTDSYFPLDDRISVFSLEGESVKHNRLLIASRLRKLIRAERPNYLINVDVSMSQVSILSFPAILGCKMLTWEQFSMASNHSWPKLLQRYVATLFSERMVVLTEADRNAYPKVLRRKVVTISNFTTVNTNSELAKLNSKVALSVGRLCAEKGFDLLIEAWKVIKNQYSDWQLRIIGGGNLRDKLQAQINEMDLKDVVTLVQPTSNIGKEYQEASLYVMPSRFEPFGLVLIEAKSFGLPIVSFDCPYGPKEIVQNERDGILVENSNVQQLSDAIMSLIVNKEKRMELGKNGREDYLQRWSEGAAIRNWKQVLQ